MPIMKSIYNILYNNYSIKNEINNFNVSIDYNNTVENHKITNNQKASYFINNYLKRFQSQNMDFDFPINGLFGYISYDSIKYFDSIKINRSNLCVFCKIY